MKCVHKHVHMPEGTQCSTWHTQCKGMLTETQALYYPLQISDMYVKAVLVCAHRALTHTRADHVHKQYVYTTHQHTGTHETHSAL